MSAPSKDDRVVNVRAFMSDEGLGYDNWHARQFASPPGARHAVLLICHDEAEQKKLIALFTPFLATAGHAHRQSEGGA